MFGFLMLINHLDVMEEPLDVTLQQALRHRANARASPADSSSAFLLTTGSNHSQFTSFTPISKKKGVSTITSSSPRSHLPTSEREAHQVFNAQLPNQPTTSAFTSYHSEDLGLSHLPGGVSLVDHVAAFLHCSPDWAELIPHVEELCQSRIPTAEEANKNVELTLGISSDEDWVKATEFIRTAAQSKSLYPFLAADTESTPLLVTWPTGQSESKFKSLTDHIAMAQLAEETELEFTLAGKGQSACGLPTRFFVGNTDKRIHVRLPVTHKKTSNGVKLTLDLTTTVSNSAKQFFMAMGTTVGVGITEDYLEWSQVLLAIWGSRFFENVSKPVELEDLARIARINTANSSIFHLNLWCFGTVLPKNMASLGNSKWGMPVDSLPLPLRMYLTADITQTARIASLLSIIITIHSFPDMTLVKDSSSFNTITFVQWHSKEFLTKLVAGWTTIETGWDGFWRKVVARRNWEIQPTLQDMLRRINPPSLDEHQLLWNTPEGPSITGGGPRSLHQARAVFLEQLPALRKLDPDSWPVHHEDKKLFWRYGLPKAACSVPLTTPISTPFLTSGPGLTNTLPSDPKTWTPADFTPMIVTNIRSERQILHEFMRLHPDKAVDVHHMSLNIPQFKSIFGRRRVIKVVNDIRNLLTHLNIPFTIPTPDPYRIQLANQKKVDKSFKHLETKLATYMTHQEEYTKRIALMQTALLEVERGAAPARFDDTSLLRVATATTGVCLKGSTFKRPKPVDKLGTAKDELQPPRKVIVRESGDFSPAPEARTVSFVTPPAPRSPSPPIIVIELPPSPPPAHIPEPTPREIYTQAIQSPDNHVFGTFDGVTLRGHDIQSLQGREWLNDNIINAYLNMMVNRSGQDGYPKVHVFSTFFYPRLSKGGYAGMSKWTAGLDIFDSEFIIIPVFGVSHWTLVVIDVRRLTMSCFNSLPSCGNPETCLRHIKGYLHDEYLNKRQRPLFAILKTMIPTNIPVQDNGFDCGVFVCQYAKHICAREAFNFSQQDVPAIRRTMTWELITNHLFSSAVNPNI